MYEYKVIPAPLRTVKVKGLSTTAERFAHLLASTVNAEADEGWEYLRSDTLPCEERKGLTGTAKSFQSVLVFRRALGVAEAGYADAADHAGLEEDGAGPGLHESGPETGEAEQAPRLSLVAMRPEPAGRQEPVLRPGAALRGARPERAEPVLRTRASDEDRTQG